MRFGYCRLSILYPETDRETQERLLTAAGCQTICIESSTVPEKGPGLTSAVTTLWSGDQLVVSSLYRLGLSPHLLLQLSDHLSQREVALIVLDAGIDTSGIAGQMFLPILASIVECDRTLRSERTLSGLAAARAKGRVGGPKRKLQPSQADLVRHRYQEVDEHGRSRWTVAQIAAEFGVSRPTVYRYLDL